MASQVPGFSLAQPCLLRPFQDKEMEDISVSFYFLICLSHLTVSYRRAETMSIYPSGCSQQLVNSARCVFIWKTGASEEPPLSRTDE